MLHIHLTISAVQNQLRKIHIAISNTFFCAIYCIEKAIRKFPQIQIFAYARRTAFIMFCRMKWTI